MKFLKAVRLDDSDARILAEESGAAQDSEWVVSGGYAVCDLAHGHRTPRCHCDTTFIAASSSSRCTIAEVSEIDAAAFEQLQENLARYFLAELGAPSLEAARAAAADECAHGRTRVRLPGRWITVRREPSDDGVGERYAVFKRLMIGSHKL
jgi:hypothetical protein